MIYSFVILISLMKELINTQQVAARIKHYRSEMTRLTNDERRGPDWYVENSSLASFEVTFGGLFPEGERLQGYIEKKLAHRGGSAIGMELGGTGSRLFSGFTPGFFQRTAGINLTDYRHFDNPDPTAEDTSRNHTVIEGDILQRSTQRKISEDFLRGDKVDLLLKRMVGADSFLPCEPFLMARASNAYYQMVAEKGLLLIEVPVAFWDIIDDWGAHIEAKYAGKLEVTMDANGPHGGVLLSKHAGAPEELPLLSVQRVKEIIDKKGEYSVLDGLFSTNS